jgi:hypothetical protein
MAARNDAWIHTEAALETMATSARAGFACLFSSADEYETALISERRAEGRYRRPSLVPIGLFVGFALIVAGAAIILG